MEDGSPSYRSQSRRARCVQPASLLAGGSTPSIRNSTDRIIDDSHSERCKNTRRPSAMSGGPHASSPVLLLHPPCPCGPSICSQLSSKVGMAIQKSINDGFHLCWILKVAVAQPVESTFPAGIRVQIKCHPRHLQAGRI